MTFRILGHSFSFGWRRMAGEAAHKETSMPTFAQMAMEEIANPVRRVSQSTVTNERTAVRAFTKYTGADLLLKDITPEVISGFERWLLDKGICPNTSACYMRSLRAVVNRLGADGKRLFRTVGTGKKRTVRKAVGTDTVGRIEGLRLEQGTQYAHARDTFMFSFYACGIPFVDLVGLKKDNVQGGHIIYRRHKTGETVTIPIVPPMAAMLEKYGRKDSPYLLPFLADGGVRSYGHYQNLLKRYNRQLRSVSEKYALPKLTSYTPRHTWATLAYGNGTEIRVIAKALGHTNPQTTLNYIKEIDNGEVDTASIGLTALVEKAKRAA